MQAWTRLGSCSGTLATTTTATSTIAAWSGGGCPSATYVAGTAYDEGALVKNNGVVYQCKVRTDLLKCLVK